METCHILQMKDEFDRCGGAVSLEQFVKIVLQIGKEEGRYTGADLVQFVSKLCTLFDEIDINGDHSMEWEEFTDYIVKNGVAGHSDSFAKKHYEESELTHEVPLNKVFKLHYFPRLDRLVVCDKSQVVPLLKPVASKYTKEFALVKELRGHTGAVLNAEHVVTQHTSMLCTSSTDNQMIFWDTTSNYRIKGVIPTPYPQVALLWGDTHNSLFSASSKGTIHIWNVQTWKEKAQLIGHTDMTLDLKFITNTPYLASASYDAKIFLWDLTSNQVATTVKGVKGACSLSYSPKYKLLFAGSSDRDVLVWNPVVQDSEAMFRLKGHHTSLVSVEVIEDTPNLITADKDGIFKLWDIRTLECVETFSSANNANLGIGAFTTMPKEKRIVAGGSRIFCFDYDKPGVPWLTDGKPVIAVLYNHTSLTIMTAAGRDIRIWDAATGVLIKSFHGVVPEDITAVCLDSRQRKIIAGTSDGSVMIINYGNGALLKTLTPHQSEVSFVAPTSHNNMYFTASWDTNLNVHDELAPPKTTTVVGGFSGPTTAADTSVGHDITCACFSPELGLLASATIGKLIRLWDTDTTAMEAQLKHHTSEITHMKFLTPYPALATCDSAGYVCIFTVRPFLHKNHLLFKFRNGGPQAATGGGEPKFSGVHASVFDADVCVMLVGDTTGCIRAWDLSKVLERARVYPLQPSKRQMQRPESEKEMQQQETSQMFDVHLPRVFTSSAPVELPEGLVTLKFWWQAHYDSILWMEPVPHSNAVLSSSRDCRVRAWDKKTGTYFGTLRQNPGGRWSLPVDSKTREKEQLRVVQQLIAGLSEEGGTSSPLPSEPEDQEADSATSVAADGSALARIRGWREDARRRELDKAKERAREQTAPGILTSPPPRPILPEEPLPPSFEASTGGEGATMAAGGSRQQQRASLYSSKYHAKKRLLKSQPTRSAVSALYLPPLCSFGGAVRSGTTLTLDTHMVMKRSVSVGGGAVRQAEDRLAKALGSV
eukprot:TRINITY_DN182_c0_g1_i5.p1 TRINITY_DN182_c0_g1~~TRINITY_DN182_c0_g1_i5.p1  ORF type:complete len:991 (-),score=210.84 TRINITY_DN182_c0_g1_i5:311-3283(-)